MLLKSRANLTCFLACLNPGRAKDLPVHGYRPRTSKLREAPLYSWARRWDKQAVPKTPVTRYQSMLLNIAEGRMSHRNDICSMGSLHSFNLLTYSMVHSPSWAADWLAASQEILRISRNRKVHYRTHKCPPPVSILGQPDAVHIPTSHLLQIHPNIIHPPTPRSPQWSPSLRFPHKDPIHTFV